MIAEWVTDETQAVDFGDARLEQRLATILTAFGSQPQASLPVAMGSRNDLDAAYEFFANPRVTPDEILGGHIAATHRRIAEQPVVILASDTTELDVTRPNSVVAGAGPLDGATRRGGLLHPLVAFTPDGTPLGTVACPWWTRAETDASTPKPTRAERAATAIEAKGGFVNRAKGSEPGPETIWKGLQRMRDYAHAWDLFGPGTKNEQK